MAMKQKLAGNRAAALAQKRLSQRKGAFTLIELLVVIAVIAILAAMLLPALSRAKSQAQSAKCRSNLHQFGLALKMYVDENRQEFPFYHVGEGGDYSWAASLEPYLRVSWTNRSIHCPAYKGGVLHIPGTLEFGSYDIGSYGYNERGTGGETLGLGSLSNFPGPNETHDPNVIFPHPPPTTEAQVAVPTEMVAMADSILANPTSPTNKFDGSDKAHPLIYPTVTWLPKYLQQPPQHGLNFNVLFCDGHAGSVKIREMFDVRKSARNWNKDHEQHTETW